MGFKQLLLWTSNDFYIEFDSRDQGFFSKFLMGGPQNFEKIRLKPKTVHLMQN